MLVPHGMLLVYQVFNHFHTSLLILRYLNTSGFMDETCRCQSFSNTEIKESLANYGSDLDITSHKLHSGVTLNVFCFNWLTLALASQQPYSKLNTFFTTDNSNVFPLFT